MSGQGKVRVVVSNRKVPVGTAAFDRPVLISQWGIYGAERKRVVIYETRFDPDQQALIDEGRKLSSDYGLDLEVIDLRRTNPLRRVTHALLGRRSLITIAPAKVSDRPSVAPAARPSATRLRAIREEELTPNVFTGVRPSSEDRAWLREPSSSTSAPRRSP